MKNLFVVLALLVASPVYASPAAIKVLVVLSSENGITLKGGLVHPTGYFLSELMVPVMALEKAGFTPVFANPKGNEPVMDKISDGPFWFGGDEEKYRAVKRHLQSLTGLIHPLPLNEVAEMDLSQFAGIFVPGGHAPMEDLVRNSDLGEILRYFHRTKKPTALICHGPIALLSTLSHPDEYLSALENKASQAELKALSKGFPYEGYELTAFSTKEEQQEETGGEDGVLGGKVKFYSDEALGNTGANSLVQATKWKSNVRVDRELIRSEE